jgi:hypothetical protein
MLSKTQQEVLKKLKEIDQGLPEGVSLTFAVDNSMQLLDEVEREQYIRTIHSLIMAGYLMNHTNRQTECGVPYWLELTKRGRNYSEAMSA